MLFYHKGSENIYRQRCNFPRRPRFARRGICNFLRGRRGRKPNKYREPSDCSCRYCHIPNNGWRIFDPRCTNPKKDCIRRHNLCCFSRPGTTACTKVFLRCTDLKRTGRKEQEAGSVRILKTKAFGQTLAAFRRISFHCLPVALPPFQSLCFRRLKDCLFQRRQNLRRAQLQQGNCLIR